MDDQQPPSGVEETGWPAEGGRSFARGTWANIGPYNYRGNRLLRAGTKTVAVLVLMFMVLTGVYFVVVSINDGTSEPSPTAPTLPAGPEGR